MKKIDVTTRIMEEVKRAMMRLKTTGEGLEAVFFAPGRGRT